VPRPTTTAATGRDDRHLTVPELAEREGVTVEAVYSWNRDGTGPPYMRIGRTCRYRLRDVQAWEESRLVCDGWR
jgi:predicted DNA-binding transcriptional regulator AlpA